MKAIVIDQELKEIYKLNYDCYVYKSLNKYHNK